MNWYCFGTSKQCFFVHSEFWFALFRDLYIGSKCWAGSSISSRISRYINLKLTCSIVFVRYNDVHIQQLSIYTKLSKIRAFEKSVLSIVAYGVYLTCITSIATTLNARNTRGLFAMKWITMCSDINIFKTFQTHIPLHKRYIFDTNNFQSEYAFPFPFSILS